MRPLRTQARELLERMLGRFFEGPDAPERLEEHVELFRKLNPAASSREWASFATRLASTAYQDGYTRGFEWRERDIDRAAQFNPAQLEQHAREERTKQLAYEQRVIPDEPYGWLPPEQRGIAVAMVGEGTGDYLIVP